MPVYTCERCLKEFSQKSHYNAHLKRKTPCQNNKDKIEAVVEKIVNEKIAAGLPVIQKEMPREEAEAIGAQMEFGQKYPDTVSVYFIGDESKPFSVEFCGGPHVKNTTELGTFKIKKEQSSAKGIRRIKGVLEN